MPRKGGNAVSLTPLSFPALVFLAPKMKLFEMRYNTAAIMAKHLTRGRV